MIRNFTFVHLLPIALIAALVSPCFVQAEELFECKNSKTGSSTYTHDPQRSDDVKCKVFKSERGLYSHTGGSRSRGGGRGLSRGSSRGGTPKGGLFGMGGKIEKKLWPGRS